MKPLVIYRANCADGFGAAFSAWTVLGDDAEYLPMQYLKNDISVSDFGHAIRARPLNNREVYILGFSFPLNCMGYVMQVASHVVWLDHHKTAFEMWESNSQGCLPLKEDEHYETYGQHKIILHPNKSSALLAWEYFRSSNKVPKLIQHIDDYERGQFKIPGTREFNAALWSYAPWSFEQWEENSKYFDSDLCGDYSYFLSEGGSILRTYDQHVQSLLERSVRCTISFREKPPANDQLIVLKGLACNAPTFLAYAIGPKLAERSGTLGLVWSMNSKGKVECSLHSIGDYDVSALAKTLGGGGNKNASNFTTDAETLLWWVK
jgi:hypothetical protein